LIQIDESRRAENAYGSSYCIFEAGCAYFQCLAPSFATYLRCEAVSEKFVPKMRAILTPEKRDQLVQEFGFAAPGYSKNFSQKIEITTKEDLAFVARMAFRVLRDIYDVTDFGATKFKVSIPEPAKPVSIQIRDRR
jgi:type III secretion system-like peptide-binding chaperone